MGLSLIVVLICGFGLSIQAVSLIFTKHRLHPVRLPRNVPETSYARPPTQRPTYTTTRPFTRPFTRPTYRPPVPPAPSPMPTGSVISIVKQTQDSSPTGEFSYSFETDNGISVEAKGSQKQLGPSEEGQVMEGRYSYTAPDGTPVEVRWFADETGFHVNQ